jgi:hypothetical protein
MDFELSDEQRLLRDTVRDFARNEVAPVAAELDETKAFPYELVRKLGGLGLMGIPFPVEYGGGGADNLSYALAVEELARIDSSVAITMAAHTSLGTMPIYLWGDDAHDALAQELLDAGKQANDVAWRFPIGENYNEQLKSNFADLANIGTPGGASITAACFLENFTRNYTWAHLDIAGTAWKSGAAKGATGRPVPLLTTFLLNRV